MVCFFGAVVRSRGPTTFERAPMPFIQVKRPSATLTSLVRTTLEARTVEQCACAAGCFRTKGGGICFCVPRLQNISRQ